jgi:hypothetical protein
MKNKKKIDHGSNPTAFTVSLSVNLSAKANCLQEGLTAKQNSLIDWLRTTANQELQLTTNKRGYNRLTGAPSNTGR